MPNRQINRRVRLSGARYIGEKLLHSHRDVISMVNKQVVASTGYLHDLDLRPTPSDKGDVSVGPFRQVLAGRWIVRSCGIRVKTESRRLDLCVVQLG